MANWARGGDGYYDETLILCTDNFTNQEVTKLKTILESKFDIKSSLNKRISTPSNNICWRLRISKFSLPNVIKLVKPYMIPEMYYKLGIKS